MLLPLTDMGPSAPPPCHSPLTLELRSVSCPKAEFGSFFKPLHTTIEPRLNFIIWPSHCHLRHVPVLRHHPAAILGSVKSSNGLRKRFQLPWHGGVFSSPIQPMGNGLVQINYTYGHALDEISNNGMWNFTQGSSLSSQNPSNLRGAYGPAEYDVRHSMNANYVWKPSLKSLLRGHGPEALFTGWQVSGTFFARTGFPYTVFDTALSGNLRQNNYFGSVYAVPIGPLPQNSGCGKDSAFMRNIHPCLRPQYQAGGAPDPKALFVQSTCETDFDAGHLPIPGDPCGGPISHSLRDATGFARHPTLIPISR